MKWIPFFESERWYIRENIKAGDSVVFKYGSKNVEKFLVKRVVAVAGQTVEYQNGIVKVDGKIIQKLDTNNNYIKLTSEFKKMIVPERSIFVLGDNVYNSFDSRFWGFIKTYQVYGKTEFIYWPKDRMGKIEHSVQYDLGK
jgi:signal peptidase I